jgi:hypothetical protein
MNLINIGLVAMVTYGIIAYYWKPAFGRPSLVNDFLNPPDVDHMQASKDIVINGPYAAKK